LEVHGFRGCKERTDFFMLCGTCIGYNLEEANEGESVDFDPFGGYGGAIVIN
jgi:hypothetical protein